MTEQTPKESNEAQEVTEPEGQKSVKETQSAEKKSGEPKSKTKKVAKSAKAKVPEKKLLILAVGRRKRSTARVKLQDGTGQIKINGRGPMDYLQRPTLHMVIMQPLEELQCTTQYDFSVNVRGGGKAGQAGAIRHGISRALSQVDEAFRVQLRKGDFLTRDARTKERKKYGQKGARKRFQFSKR